MDTLQTTHTLKCISDPLRLRILNLLAAGPLCVCHIQEILDTTQVRISKQLALMKQIELITATREGTWMLYQLKKPINGLLQANLCYLRSSSCTELEADLQAREQLVQRIQTTPNDCPAPVCETIGCC
ncbi:MAG: ArsR/SmtB family transcription factor [Coraliomargaritaceae bacterium]